MITERLMKPGQFTVKLRADAPNALWGAVQEFDHIVVTPTRLRPVSGFSDASLLAAAIYAGVILRKPTNTAFEGAGLANWLGDDDGAGPVLDTAVSNTAATLSTWTTSLLPSAITAGTITNTGNTLTYNYQWMTRREAYSHMARSVGAEWRVNPDFTLDAAAPATLFVTTPTTVVTRKAGGPGALHQGVQATQISQARDVSKYTTKVIVVGKNGDGALVATGSATGANVYKDGLNNNVVVERLVNAPNEPAASTTAYATSVLALYGDVRRVISLSSDTYAVPRHTRPGDYLWVYDPPSFLADLANQTTWRGEVITPIKLRCHGYTWPLQRGMGVYARRSGSTPTYTDLSDYIEWEDGANTTWEIGASFADPDQEAAQLSPAFLGVNADVVARTVVPPATTWTPTVANLTVGNGAWSTTTYTIGSDGFCDFQGRFVCGTTSAVTGRLTVTLPFTCAHSVRPGQFAAGVYDDSAGATHPLYCSAVGNATQFALDAVATGGTYAVAAASSATVPITYANLDAIEFSGRFRLA